MADQEQINLARSLKNKIVRFKNEAKTEIGRRVNEISPDGMVEIDGMSGHFAPELFEVVNPTGEAERENYMSMFSDTNVGED